MYFTQSNLAKLTERGREHMDRTKEIVKVSIIGVCVNVALASFKTAVGLAARSTAVLLDAVNNLSDVLSSVITIVGTKLAGRGADREHPYGHGRVEYITSAIVSIVVITAGLVSLKESVVKIIRPVEPKFTAVSAAVIAAAVITKIFLGRFYISKSRKLSSTTLKASGADALGDAVITGATLISALINMACGLNLEGWLGVIISLFILKAGYEMIRETFDSIIGVRADAELTDLIKQRLCSYEEVRGAYDLILHSYGPAESFGSVHLELCDNMTVRELDALTRRIVPDIYAETGVLLTIGVYAANNSDEESIEINNAVREETAKYPQITQLHGFYADSTSKHCSFDLMFDYSEPNKTQLAESIRGALSERFPEYTFYINIDRDFSE